MRHPTSVRGKQLLSAQIKNVNYIKRLNKAQPGSMSARGKRYTGKERMFLSITLLIEWYLLFPWAQIDSAFQLIWMKTPYGWKLFLMFRIISLRAMIDLECKGEVLLPFSVIILVLVWLTCGSPLTPTMKPLLLS